MIIIYEKFWNSDWFIGLSVGIILLLATGLNWLQPLEQKVYDWGIHFVQRPPNDKVAVIAIDEDSLGQLGEWPWWRLVYAQWVDLVAPQSKVIGITLDFSQTQLKFKPEPKTSLVIPAPSYWLEEVTELKKLLEEIGNTNRGRVSGKQSLKPILAFYRSARLFSNFPETLSLFTDNLQQATDWLNSDLQLANSFQRAGNIILGMPWRKEGNYPPLLMVKAGSEPPLAKGEINQSSPPLPKQMLKYRLTPVNKPIIPYFNDSKIVKVQELIPPLALLSNSVLGLGYFTAQPAGDARTLPLIVEFKQNYFPSLSLLLVAKNLSVNLSDLEVQIGRGLKLGNLALTTDRHLQVQPFFYESSKIRVDSFAKVLTGQIPVDTYRDKIVLLGVTAPPYATMLQTPRGEMPAVLVLANEVSSLLNQDYLVSSPWSFGLAVGLWGLILAYAGFWLPRLTWRPALEQILILLVGLIAVNWMLLNQGWTLPTGLPSLLLLLPLTQLALSVKRLLIAYQDAFRSHPEAVESNRLLGLAFQGQGHLDLAYDKFRLCPPEESIMGLLYNLALDYELKRQFRRASAVYRYVQSQQPAFRDVEQRLAQLQILKKSYLRHNHNHSHSHQLENWWLDDEGNKPMLGRYQLERLLGKGAMGVVYLGRDSKLDRLVAIKTLALSQEFEDQELEDATQRFFREATAAGRLKHPNIVAIYEAGEEQDLAYISMEFFKGGNLSPYTKSENLLPIITVIKIIIVTAEALDYASKQGVVHRDIKPANIMYNPATEQIKITDFGIACITNSNKTKTGIILGSPSYMSPEQLAGNQVDGRSDLFSLGVMCYQLLTGALPFQADTMASLMFKITHESHHDLTAVRANLPLSLKSVVDTALQKNVTDRFQTGVQFAQALRDCQILGEV